MRVSSLLVASTALLVGLLAWHLRVANPPTKAVVTVAQPKAVRIASQSQAAKKLAVALQNHSVAVQVGESVHDLLERWRMMDADDQDGREAVMHDLMELLSNGNAGAMVRSMTTQDFDTSFGSLAFERWLEVEPMAAAQWMAERRDGRNDQAAAVAKALLRTPGLLLSHCDALPEGKWKERLVASATLQAVPLDRTVAIALAERLDGADRVNALETIAYDWFGRDPDRALHWAATMPDSVEQERLFAVGAKAIAVTDPDLAATWLTSTVRDSNVLNSTAVSIVELWASRQPSRAADWVTQLRAGTSRIPAIDLVLSQWTKSDPAAANRWLQSLPDHKLIVGRQNPSAAGPDDF